MSGAGQSTVSIPHAIQIGLAHHQAGRLPEAEGIYRQVLQVEPNNAEALHLLGVIAHQVGNNPASVEYINLALAARPEFAEALSNRGLALQALGRHEEALASYDRALELNAGYSEALSNRGNALRELGRHEEALASYDRALALRPDFAEALSNRGNVLKALGRHEEALASFDKALLAQPGHADALNNRGLVLQALKRHDEALASYDLALSARPGFVEAMNNRGFVLHEAGRLAESLASLEAALAADPSYAGAWYNRGNTLRDLNRGEEALASYEKAISIYPEFFDAWNNRGNALKVLRRFSDALASYDRALAIDPGHAGAWSNRGTALYELGRHEEALVSYARALAIAPDYSDAHWNEGLCRLIVADLETGWKKIEWRWQTEEFRARRRGFSQPLWLGKESLEGKTILLHAEQGLGDAIQFCRYAPMVAALGATVILDVLPALASLLGRLEGVSHVVARGEPLPGFDYHCPLLSLPLAFGTTLESIPAKVPYLFADPARVKEWKKRLGAKRKPRVGIAWSATSQSAYGIARSIPFDEFAGLIPKGVQCVSLQKDLTEAEREAIEARKDVVHFGAGFEDTAALVELMDVVVSVDTSIGHLSGAMGKATWILLPYVGDWRWMTAREDSPWYPGVRLFRQPVPGDWPEVIGRVKEQLERLKK